MSIHDIQPTTQPQPTMRISPCLQIRHPIRHQQPIQQNLRPQESHADINLLQKHPIIGIMRTEKEKKNGFGTYRGLFWQAPIHCHTLETIILCGKDYRCVGPFPKRIDTFLDLAPISKEEYERLTDIKSARQEADSRAEYMWSDHNMMMMNDLCVIKSGVLSESPIDFFALFTRNMTRLIRRLYDLDLKTAIEPADTLNIEAYIRRALTHAALPGIGQQSPVYQHPHSINPNHCVR